MPFSLPKKYHLLTKVAITLLKALDGSPSRIVTYVSIHDILRAHIDNHDARVSILSVFLEWGERKKLFTNDTELGRVILNPNEIHKYVQPILHARTVRALMTDDPVTMTKDAHADACDYILTFLPFLHTLHHYASGMPFTEVYEFVKSRRSSTNITEYTNACLEYLERGDFIIINRQTHRVSLTPSGIALLQKYPEDRLSHPSSHPLTYMDMLFRHTGIDTPK